MSLKFINTIIKSNINDQFLKSNKSAIIDLLFKHVVDIRTFINTYQNNEYQKKDIVKIRDDNLESINFNSNDPHILIKSLFALIYNICISYSKKQLDSKKEYFKLDYHIIYKVLVVNTEELRKLFSLFVVIYKLEPYLTKKKYYIGIDYEFHKGKDIRLMQINFERKPSLKRTITSFIWIIKPPDLNTIQHNILIQDLMEHSKIYKIMNGADALDTPYMIKELFVSNKNTIQKFFATFVDLRYLCEFYKANFASDDKCDIYSAYLYFGIITQEKHDMLNEGNETVVDYVRSLLWEKSSSSDDIWNIDKMDEAILYYVVFDVIYLKFHLLRLLEKSQQQSNFITSMKLIPFLTRYSLYEKHSVTNITEEIKKYVDPINNFYFFKDKLIIKLIDAYKYFSENMYLIDINIDIIKLMKVNYFRNFVMYLLKAVIYYYIVNKTTVFVKTNVKYNNTYEITSLYKNMERIGFVHLNTFLKSVYKNVDNNFNKILVI